MPALHAFTESGYTASFTNKGKKRAVKLMKKEHFTSAFAKIGQEELDPHVLEEVEKFACTFYNMYKLAEVNSARYALFQQKFASRKRDGQLDKSKV